MSSSGESEDPSAWEVLGRIRKELVGQCCDTLLDIDWDYCEQWLYATSTPLGHTKMGKWHFQVKRATIYCFKLVHKNGDETNAVEFQMEIPPDMSDEDFQAELIDKLRSEAALL